MNVNSKGRSKRANLDIRFGEMTPSFRKEQFKMREHRARLYAFEPNEIGRAVDIVRVQFHHAVAIDKDGRTRKMLA
jgi:hypothetical protein